MTGQKLKSKPKLVPQQLILCDDVRVEATGKFILIGVYTDGIAVSDLPAQVNIALFVTFEVFGTGIVPVEIEIRGPIQGNKMGIKANANLNPKSSEDASKTRIVPLVIGGISFPAIHEGDVTIVFRQNEGEWKNLRTFPIRKILIPNIERKNLQV